VWGRGQEKLTAQSQTHAHSAPKPPRTKRAAQCVGRPVCKGLYGVVTARPDRSVGGCIFAVWAGVLFVVVTASGDSITGACAGTSARAGSSSGDFSGEVSWLPDMFCGLTSWIGLSGGTFGQAESGHQSL
jgi:hypothetical protein